MTHQKIRPSTFITSYGPGAILEASDGPRIILDAEEGLFRGRPELLEMMNEQFRINDPRMSKCLLDDANIFRLPTDAEANLPPEQATYRTNSFPTWKMCLNDDGHDRRSHVLYRHDSCPACHITTNTGQEAIRFVRACPMGHMDECDWGWMIHRDTQCNARQRRRNEEFYYWNQGDTGSLADVVLSCPGCDATENFGNQYYNDDMPCSARQPELEEHGPYTRPNRKSRGRRGACLATSKIIMRRAANLRIPEIKTLLSITSAQTRLHELMRNDAIIGSLATYRTIANTLPQNKDQLQTSVLDPNVQLGKLRRNTMEIILQDSMEHLAEVMEVVTRDTPQYRYGELIVQEFQSLMRGSEEGIPPQAQNQGGGGATQLLTEMDHNMVVPFSCDGIDFQVCPVDLLNTVKVQTGYRREVAVRGGQNATPSRLVKYNNQFQVGGGAYQKWYPGVRYTGEGIFIRLAGSGSHLALNGPRSDMWLEAYNNRDAYQDYLFRDPHQDDRIELHPVFVWWHTLSHLLVRAMAEDAGYSSASINERVYLELDGERAKGGILLYSTQPGSQGSMGGLIALVPYFDRLLELAFDHLITCSGDPLCMAEQFKPPEGGEPKKVNGSACYGCLMNSETSCEHRNMWLDRQVMKENLND